MAQGRLFPFVPVFFALGIGGYFLLPAEPTPPHWATAAVLMVASAAGWLRGPVLLRPFACALMLLLAGAIVAGLRSHHVAAPVLGWRYYGPVEGRIVGIDKSVSDQVRLTLDRVVLRDIPPHRTPDRVRVSLHGTQGHLVPQPGLTVILTGHLSPPEGPVEPGTFDFRRMAWFNGLGAVGYTRTPALVLEPPEPASLGMAIFRLRMAISAHVRAAIPGEPGGFVAAILTGDRSGIARETTDALRGSNLAHLLAISGLHMGLLTGFVFAALRYGIALVPPLALRVSSKKLAAVVALAAGAFYLALSGGNVATERAFVMVAVMLVAVLADRRAISLRSVAIAAMIVLALRPEALLEPGFQMSFAATTVLVAVFRLARDRPHLRRRLPRWSHGAVSLVVASAVAGFATAPVAAAHFNRIADYGLLANLLAMPVMGTLVMPSAVIAGVLAPFGLSGLGLALMEQGTRWILWVAHWVSGLDGAVRGVMQPRTWALPVLSLGALWLILWPGRARIAGLLPMALALALWSAPRPPVLVAPAGALVGVLDGGTRSLSKPRGAGFAARLWLEQDGSDLTQAEAHAAGGWTAQGTAHLRDGAPWPVAHLAGRHARDLLADHCHPGVLVVMESTEARPRDAARATDGPVPLGPGGCWLMDGATLGGRGAAIWPVDGQPLLRLAGGTPGARPWLGPAPRPARD